jgi:hypothetical protein
MVGLSHHARLSSAQGRWSRILEPRIPESHPAAAEIGRRVASASPHETQLFENTLERRFLAETPERLIGDRAYYSDPLDAQIRDRFGVQLVAPHNSTRSRKATQDGRMLRRYRRRWKSSVCSLGFITFDVSSFAGNTTQRISSGWCSWLAPSSS